MVLVSARVKPRLRTEKFPDGFAKGTSETSADAAVGTRQQSSALQARPIYYCHSLIATPATSLKQATS
jgi:hypothetical protein